MYGLIGKTLKYSKSKEIHTLYREMKHIEGNYNLIELEEEDLKKFMEETIFNYNGINVTIPYKEKVMPYLDKITKEALDLGSVNTIKVEDGKLIGYNTDIFGFSAMMRKHRIYVKDKDVIILGTGATAHMIKFFCHKKSAKSVKFVSRDPNKGDYTYEDNFSGQVLINTTPMGVATVNDESPVHIDVLKSFTYVLDINYNPYRTKLLRDAISLNKQVASGFYMLISQGLKSRSIWSGDKYQRYFTDRIYSEISNTNVVLIGMPGCGKTTIGKALESKLNKKYISIDGYIEEKEQMTIPEMFAISEDYFREKEALYTKEISKMKNVIIDTGGGIVLNPENMNELYKNGTVFYINRSLKNIKSTMITDNRPLLQKDTNEKLDKLYKERSSLYEKYGEIKITNTKKTETINIICREYEKS
ncbi:MAG: shikimate kinase [Lachnospirales bacterium]